jgi:hypothetical protein
MEVEKKRGNGKAPQNEAFGELLEKDSNLH